MRLAYVLASLGAALLLGTGEAAAQRIVPHVEPIAPHIAPMPTMPRIEPIPRAQPLPRLEPAPRLDPIRPDTIRPAPSGNYGSSNGNSGNGAYASGPSGYASAAPSLPAWPDYSYAPEFARQIVEGLHINDPTLRAHLLDAVAGVESEPGDIQIAAVSDDVVRSAIANAVAQRIGDLGGRYAYAPSAEDVAAYVQSAYAASGPHIAFVAGEANSAIAAYDSVIAALDGVVGAGGPLTGRTIVVPGADRHAVMTAIPKDQIAARGRPAFVAPEEASAPTSDATATSGEVVRELRAAIDAVRNVGAAQLVVIDLMPQRVEDALAWGFADYEARRYADVGARMKQKLATLAAAGVDVRRPRSRAQFWRTLQRAQAGGKTVVVVGESNLRSANGRERRIVQIPGTADVLRPRDFHGMDTSRLVGLFCHSRAVLGGEAAGAFDAQIMGRDAIRGVEAVRIALKTARMVLPVDARPDAGRDVDDISGGAPALHVAYEFMHAFDDATAAAGGGGDGGDPPQTWLFRAFAVDPDDDDGGFWGFLERMFWRLMGLFAGRDEGR